MSAHVAAVADSGSAVEAVKRSDALFIALSNLLDAMEPPRSRRATVAWDAAIAARNEARISQS